MSNPKSNEKPNRMQEALATIQAKVGDIMNSDQWLEALKFRKKFTNYSLSNILLIWAQKQDSTRVAGYKKWLELGRQVRKGEKGIRILAPIIRKDPENDNKTRLVGFRFATVFDISQTEGEDIPDLPKPEQLTEDHPLVPELLQRAIQHTNVLGHALHYEDIKNGALGYYKPADKSITLKTNLPPLQELKTLIHELTHAILEHDGKDENRNLKELEAETAAFLTLDALGIDTSSYSFVYLAHWTDDLKTLIAAGDRAAKVATKLVDALQLEVIPTTTTSEATLTASNEPATPRLLA